MIGLIIFAVLLALVLLFVFLPVVAWCLLGFVAIVIFVILLIPVGINGAYKDGEVFLAARIGFFSLSILPQKKEKLKKAEKPKKENKQKDVADEAATTKRKLNFSADELLELIKKVLRSLAKLGKLTVHKFILHYIAAGKDPYKTAMSYNYVNAAMSSLAPICRKAVKIRGEADVWTDIDFTADNMSIEAELSVSLRVIQLVHVALVAGFGVLGVLIKNKRRLSKEARLKKAESTVNDTEMINENNINTEERKDSNG